MARYELPNNFFIECKPGCYWLRRKYMGKTKEGLPREASRNHGYFLELSGALHKFLEVNTLNGLQAVEIWEVGKLVEELNKKAVYKLQRILEGNE